MIVDSSALIAIIFGEHEGDDLLRVLRADSPRISAATYFEVGMVIDRKAVDGFPAEAFERLLTMMQIEVVPSRAIRRSWRARPIASSAKAITRPG